MISAQEQESARQINTRPASPLLREQLPAAHTALTLMTPTVCTPYSASHCSQHLSSHRLGMFHQLFQIPFFNLRGQGELPAAS